MNIHIQLGIHAHNFYAHTHPIMHAHTLISMHIYANVLAYTHIPSAHTSFNWDATTSKGVINLPISCTHNQLCMKPFQFWDNLITNMSNFPIPITLHIHTNWKNWHKYMKSMEEIGKNQEKLGPLTCKSTWFLLLVKIKAYTHGCSLPQPLPMLPQIGHSNTKIMII